MTSIAIALVVLFAPLATASPNAFTMDGWWSSRMLMRCMVPPSFVICWDSQKLFES